jgi:predicted nucleotide-binding protein (sugar kinase/HSP70/actin superfamily)
MAKQTNIPKVDEDFMREVISQGLPMKRDATIENERTIIIDENESAIETSDVIEAPNQEQTEKVDYCETYFEKVDLTYRQSLCITKETHLTLLNVVNMIGGRKANLSSYVENIILQHLETHKEEINELYENGFKRPIL